MKRNIDKPERHNLPRRRANVLTAPDAAEEYPEAGDNATVFPAQFINATFPREQGPQEISGISSERPLLIWHNGYLESGSQVGAVEINNRWFATPSAGSVYLVICHWRATTSAGTGSISRLDSDGNVLWTYDTPIEETTGRRKRPLDVALDSSGNIYANYDLEASTPSRSYETNGDGPAGGCISLTSGGELRFDTEFPEKWSAHATPVPAVYVRPPRVVISDDDDIYCGAGTDVNGNQLHRLDTDGTIQQSYHFSSDPTLKNRGFLRALALDHEGKLWGATNVQHPDDELLRYDPDGTLLYQATDLSNLSISRVPSDLAFDALNRWVMCHRAQRTNPLAISPPFVQNRFAAKATDTEPVDASVDDWDPPIGIGRFNTNHLPSGSHFGAFTGGTHAGDTAQALFLSVTAAGGDFIFGSEDARFETQADQFPSEWNLWKVSNDGTPLWVRQLGGEQLSQTAGGSAGGKRVYDIDYDADSDILLAVSGAEGNTGGNIARLNLATGAHVWSKTIGAGNTYVYGCAVRTIN